MPLPNLTQEETDELNAWRTWLQETAINQGTPLSSAPAESTDSLKVIIRKFHSLDSEAEVPLPGWIDSAVGAAP